jgi:hypothetical protein
MNRLTISLKALRQLGVFPVILNSLYRLGLKTGWYRFQTPLNQRFIIKHPLAPGFSLHLPDPNLFRCIIGDQQAELLTEANEILAGQVRLFGTEPTTLQLSPPPPLQHWSCTPEGEDIKFIWEPARLGWVFTLARAYLLTADDSYAKCFWQLLDTFLVNNPPNLGPNWSSGQEVALRILALVFAHQVFGSSAFSTSENQERLLAAIAVHASRIPPTLIYARAQNNNHLLTEAAGLFTAGTYLHALPQAKRWQSLGWKWFNKALANQITPDGIYIQHSTNYHRLMLQTALWIHSIAKNVAWTIPPQTIYRLAAASQWLMVQLDPISGRVPNLGHNDGAYIFPLASGGFSDYRPVAQAAARAFLGSPCLPPGYWDEFSLWLGLPVREPPSAVQSIGYSPSVYRLGSTESWGILRAAHFSSRPAHADQLHVDLWWHGDNIALDAGTYRYTAPLAWDNTLAHTAVHNTIMIDDLDQMTHAGRFLWLDWAQAVAHPLAEKNGFIAEHSGYVPISVHHHRTLRQTAYGWQISDDLVPLRHHNREHKITLHWLLPDWPWAMQQDNILAIQAPGGSMHIQIVCQPSTLKHNEECRLIRSGTVLSGPLADLPSLGWFSPTYAQKVPALSFQFVVRSVLPLTLTTTWILDGVQ